MKMAFRGDETKVCVDAEAGTGCLCPKNRASDISHSYNLTATTAIG